MTGMPPGKMPTTRGAIMNDREVILLRKLLEAMQPGTSFSLIKDILNVQAALSSLSPQERADILSLAGVSGVEFWAMCSSILQNDGT